MSKLTKMNGFWKKYAPWIISNIIVIITFIASTTVFAMTLRYDIDAVEEDCSTNEVRIEKSEECITNVRLSLSRIEGMLEIVTKPEEE